MKRSIISISAAFALTIAAISGDYVTRSMGAGGIAVTNEQKNASWELSAVAIKFGDTLPVSTETVRVSRVSQGIEFVLSETQVFGQTMVLTTPENMAFKFGDVIKVYAGGATGSVQVFTK